MRLLHIHLIAIIFFSVQCHSENFPNNIINDKMYKTGIYTFLSDNKTFIAEDKLYIYTTALDQLSVFDLKTCKYSRVFLSKFFGYTVEENENSSALFVFLGIFDGNIYIANNTDGKIYKYSLDFEFKGIFAENIFTKNNKNNFYLISEMVKDKNNNFHIVDCFANRILILDTNGELLKKYGEFCIIGHKRKSGLESNLFLFKTIENIGDKIFVYYRKMYTDSDIFKYDIYNDNGEYIDSMPYVKLPYNYTDFINNNKNDLSNFLKDYSGKLFKENNVLYFPDRIRLFRNYKGNLIFISSLDKNFSHVFLFDFKSKKNIRNLAWLQFSDDIQEIKEKFGDKQNSYYYYGEKQKYTIINMLPYKSGDVMILQSEPTGNDVYAEAGLGMIELLFIDENGKISNKLEE